LDKLRNQKNQIQAQRSDAEAKLSTDSKSRTRVNPVDGLTYVFIPAGAFTMGCSPGDTECSDYDKPAHAVQIAKGFWLGQTEVTQAAWKKVMNGQNPSVFKSDQLPVDSVTWTEAASYCKAVNGRLPKGGRVGIRGSSRNHWSALREPGFGCVVRRQ
jgi:formylglycine-generating enzyme required for sulfatase activity